MPLIPNAYSERSPSPRSSLESDRFISGTYVRTCTGCYIARGQNFRGTIRRRKFAIDSVLRDLITTWLSIPIVYSLIRTHFHSETTLLAFKNIPPNLPIGSEQVKRTAKLFPPISVTPWVTQGRTATYATLGKICNRQIFRSMYTEIEQLISNFKSKIDKRAQHGSQRNQIHCKQSLQY